MLRKLNAWVLRYRAILIAADVLAIAFVLGTMVN